MVKEEQVYRDFSDPLEKLLIVSSQERALSSTESLILGRNTDFADNITNQSQVKVRIPASGSYNLLITERWESTLESLMFRIDGGSWRDISAQELKDELAIIRGVQLSKGDHKIYLKNSVPNYNFDCAGVLGFFLLKGSETGGGTGVENQGGEKERVASIELEEVNVTKYLAHVKAQEPFFLHFNQPFHPNWTASTKGKVNPYHFQDEEEENVWFIEKAGTYDLVIEYQGLDPLRTLRWANLAGLAIFLFLIPCDLYRLQKSRKDLSKASP